MLTTMRDQIPSAFRAGLLLTILLFLVAGCDQSPSSPGTNKPAELQLNLLELSPMVTKPGEPFTLEILLRGATESEIHVYTSPAVLIGPNGTIIPVRPSELTQNGVERDYLVLTEDETKTPPSPSETWFIADDIILPIEENGVETVTTWDLLIVEPGQTAPFPKFSVLLSFRTADPAIIGNPPVTELDTDVRATSRAINIISDDVDDVEQSAMSRLAQRYYSFFPDDRDFLIVQKPPNVSTEAGGWFFISGALAKGLGDNFSRSPSIFGSSGRLKGVIESLRGIYSRSSSGEDDFCLLTHELLHRWAAYMEEPSTSGNGHWSTDPLLGLDRGHSGFGYGGSWVCELNDFELYLAGFIPADSVATPLNQNGYTIDDFINDNGSREPAYPDTQRDFNIGFIIEHNRPLTDHEMAYFHYIAEEVTKTSSPLSRTWYEATGGRSSLNSELSVPANSLP